MQKKWLLAIFLVLPFISVDADADGSGVITGKWTGLAVASGTIDLNGDGNGARVFDVRARDQLAFYALQGIVDTALVAVPGQPGNLCPNPEAEFELQALGKITLQGWGDDNALFTEVDSSLPLCFNPLDPDETLVVHITEGIGVYANKTGTVTFRLFDRVLYTTAEGFPLAVDTRGNFTVVFDP